MIFTIPESLNRFWQFNRTLFANRLLQASREALLELLADPRYLGAQPGIISALHTWGRNLSVHPHVHCLVTAGGLTRDGEFIVQKRSTLLPARVLMMVFRSRLRALLIAALADGTLTLPTGITLDNAQSLLNRLGHEPWNVRIQERYPHGVSVAGYLARYITGGPISDRRLVSVCEKQIVFRYRDYRDGRNKLMRMSPPAFLSRWFEHVPPRGLRMIRRSGLYANCHRRLRNRLRAEAAERPSPRRGMFHTAVIMREPERCPKCHRVVRTIELSRPAYAPPETPMRTQTKRPLGQPP